MFIVTYGDFGPGGHYIK